jgi:hypothetical protein
MRHEGKTVTEAIKSLTALFAPHTVDRSTLDELGRMADDRNSWNQAHDLFQRIRHKSLEATQRGDAKLEVQFGFEEACAKTLYNLAGRSAPFDPDSPYWVVPNALATARHYDIAEGEVLRAIRHGHNTAPQLNL